MTAEGIAEARKTAIACANAAEWVLLTAKGIPEPPPRMAAEIERLLAPLRWCPDDESPEDKRARRDLTLLTDAIEGLCQTLDKGRGQIANIEAWLPQVSLGPVEAGGMTRATGHALAWEYAHHLWLSIREIDPEFQNLEPRGFRLHPRLVNEHIAEIVPLVAAREPFNRGAVVAQIQREAAQLGLMCEVAGRNPVKATCRKQAGPGRPPRIPDEVADQILSRWDSVRESGALQKVQFCEADELCRRHDVTSDKLDTLRRRRNRR